MKMRNTLKIPFFFRVICVVFICIFVVQMSAFASRCSSNNPGSFEIRTVDLSTTSDKKVEFYIGAEGSFTVDWGDGTTTTIENRITGDGVTTSGNNGSPYLSHTYSSGGQKDIIVSGCATKYRRRVWTAEWYEFLAFWDWTELKKASNTILFSEHNNRNTPEKISRITGSLGSVFPTRGGGNNNDPSYEAAFQGCTNFTLRDKNNNLNEDLFGPEITHTVKGMFRGTFADSGVDEIPENLFLHTFGPACNLSGVEEADSMFAYTFKGTPISSIPGNLFAYRESGWFGATSSGIRCSGDYMFKGTFKGCHNLSGYGIPQKLFRKIGKNAENGGPRKGMFEETFADTNFGDSTLRYAAGQGNMGLNLFPSGHADALYKGTFQGNTGLEDLNYRVFPADAPSKGMFESTFMDTTNLKKAGGCNSGYTDNVFGPLAAGNGYDSDAIFRSTFKGSTIKSVTNNLFGLYRGGGTQAFAETFEGCANLKNDNSPSSCSSLTVSHSWLPGNIFENITDHGDGLFFSTFKDSGLSNIPSTLFSKLTGSATTGSKMNNMFYYTFYNTPITSVPANLFRISSVGDSTFRGTFAFCDRLGQDTNGKINSNNSPIMSHYDNMGVNNTGGIYSSRGTYAFQAMFEGCTRLTDIAANLIPALTSFKEGMFVRTFARSGLTSVPSSLFHSSGKAPQKNLFKKTFAGCSNLQTVANDIFASMVGAPAESMFEGTFMEEGCDENGENCQYACGLNTTMEYLGSLFFGTGWPTNPNGVQVHVAGSPAKAMFKNTFKGCHGLTGKIPNYFFLLATNGPAAESMFEGTFQRTGISGTVKASIFDNLTGTAAPAMFKNTFKDCTELENVGQTLFNSISGAPAESMFEGTFDGCSGLSADLSGLQMFNNISGPLAEKAFKNTFRGCSNLTGSLSDRFFGTVSGSAAEAFAGTFKGDTGLTSFVPKPVFSGIYANAPDSVFTDIFKGATNMVTDCYNAGYAPSTSSDRCYSFEKLPKWGNGENEIVRCCGEQLDMRTVTYNPGANDALPHTPLTQRVEYEHQFDTFPIGTFLKDNAIMSQWNTISGGSFPIPGGSYRMLESGDTILQPNWQECICKPGVGVAHCDTSSVTDTTNGTNSCEAKVLCKPGYANPYFNCSGASCESSCTPEIYTIRLDYDGGSPTGGANYVVNTLYLKYGVGFYTSNANAIADTTNTHALTNLASITNGAVFNNTYKPVNGNKPYQGFYAPYTASQTQGDRGGGAYAELQVINRTGDFTASSKTFTTSDAIITARYGDPIYTLTFDDAGGYNGAFQAFLRYQSNTAAGPFTPKFYQTYEDAVQQVNEIQRIRSIPEYPGYRFRGYYLPEDSYTSQTRESVYSTGLFNSLAFVTGRTVPGPKRITDDVTLTAQWESKMIPICLDHGGADNATSFHDKVWLEYNTDYHRDSNGTVDLNRVIHFVDIINDNGSIIPQKTGYVFKGYYGPEAALNNRDGGGNSSDPGGNATLVVNTSGRFINKTFAVDEGIKDCSCGPKAKIACPTTITAKFNKNIHRVNLNDNGGSGGSPTPVYLWYGNGFYANSAATGERISEFTIPTRDGYRFDGYYHGEDCSIPGTYGANRQSSCVQIIDGTGRHSGNNTFAQTDTELVALWTPNVYRITINDNCGETPCTRFGSPTEIFLRYGNGFYRTRASAESQSNRITNMDVTPQRTGYSFDGYSHTSILRDSGNGGGGQTGITVRKIVTNSGNILDTDSALTFTTEDTTINADWLGACNVVILDPNHGTSGSVGKLFKRTGSTAWYSDPKCTTAYVMTDDVVPTKRNFVFRGFYAAPAPADVDSNADNTGITQYIMTNGALSYDGYNLVVTGDTTIYAAWARECNSINPGECHLDVTLGGIVTYTLDCPEGFQENGEGTWNPSCTPVCYPITVDNTSRGGTTANSVLYKFGGGQNATKWYTNDRCTVETTTSPAPSKLNATFKGYFWGTRDGSQETSTNLRSLIQVGSNGNPSELSNEWTITGPETITAYYDCNQNYSQNGVDIIGTCENSIYDIILDGNGGSGGNGAIYEKYNVGYSLARDATEWDLNQLTEYPEYTDYSFRGYYTTQVAPLEANGNTGTVIIKKDGALPTSPTRFEEDTIVYAGWARKCVSPVSHGSCSLNIAAGGEVTYTTSCDTGYVLSNGTGGTYNPICEPGLFTVTLDSKYYADVNASGVSANTNAAPSPIYVRYADNWYKSTTINSSNIISTLTTKPLYSTYVFDGFWTEKTGTGTQIIDRTGAILSGHTTDFTANRSLYAKWVQTNCSVTNGTGTPLAPTNNVPACSITCTNGYSQNGYLDTTTSFTANGTAGSNTVTATCVARTYKVTLDPKRYADANAQTGVNPTTTGTTEYWYRYKTSPSTSPSTACYYYTVALASSADEVAANCIGGNHGDTITKPTMSGYAFDGYYVNKPGSGTQYVLNTGVATGQRWNNVASDGTLYAKWNPNTYNITYNLKGGDEPSGNNASDFMPVEYIASTSGGNQYIDTLYKLQSNNVEYKWTARDDSSSSGTSLFGTEGTQSGTRVFSGVLHGSKSTRTLWVGSSQALSIGYASNDSLYHDWKLHAANNTVSLTKDGTLVNSQAYAGSLYKDKNIVLFGNRTGTTGAGQYALAAFKRFSIVDNGVLAFNGIPVRQISTNKCGLYDTVSNTFFPSATSTAFTCPDVPARPTSVIYDTVFGPVENPTRPHSTFTGWHVTGMDATTHYAGATSSVSSIGTSTTYNPATNIAYYKNLTSVNNGTVTFTATWTCDVGYASNAAGTSCDAVNYPMTYTCSDNEFGYTFSTAPSSQTAHYLQSAPVGTGVSLPSGNSCQKIYGELGDPDYCADCFNFMGWRVKAEETALYPTIPAPHAAGSTIPTWGKTGNTTWCKVSGVNDDWGSTAGSCATFTDSTPFTIRPVYEPKTYTISYVYATSTGLDTGNRPGTYVYTYGRDTISAADLSLAHGHFDGWCKDSMDNCAEGLTTSVGPRDYGPHIYYAKWSCDAGYTLSYDANGNPVCNANTITCNPGFYLEADTVTCEPCLKDYYCEGGTFVYNGTDQGLSKCPTPSEHKRTTFPDNYYTFVSWTSTSYANTAPTSAGGYSAITQCKVINWLSFNRGKLYEYVKYNATTEKYEVSTGSWGWSDVNAGYYLTTKSGCGSYAYYHDAFECIAGGYCPGKSRVTCNSSNQATVHTITFGLNVCGDNSYSDMGASACTACPGNGAYTNSGDEFTDHAYVTSCKTTCGIGQCLPTAGGQCINAGAGNWSAGGTVSYGSVLACNVCGNGMTTIGYGYGADEAGDCGRILHIGGNRVYLRSALKTTPSLRVKIGDTVFYGNMSTTMTNMSDGIAQKLKLKYNNTAYSVYDDSAMN